MIIQRVQAGNVNQRIQITPKGDRQLSRHRRRQEADPAGVSPVTRPVACRTGCQPEQQAAAKAHVEQLLSRIRGASLSNRSFQ